MRVSMQLDCEHCGVSKLVLVPAKFHYSDGCYTVLAIDKQECECVLRNRDALLQSKSK